jgi:hypothetical protein
MFFSHINHNRGGTNVAKFASYLKYFLTKESF